MTSWRISMDSVMVTACPLREYPGKRTVLDAPENPATVDGL
jgi:hypothetical protein